MNSNKFEKYCEKVATAFKNDKNAATVFSEAAKALDSVLGGNYGRDKAKEASLFSNAAATIKQV